MSIMVISSEGDAPNPGLASKSIQLLKLTAGESI